MRMDDTAAQLPRIAVSLDSPLEHAFEQQVRACADMAVRIAFSILRKREDAEEVAQEAFVRAHARARDLGDPDHFRAWIVRTTWRLAIDRWRADRRRQAREQSSLSAPEERNAEQLAIASERSSRLWDAIDSLPEKLRLATVLSSMYGHDVGEVARLLAIPEGTVKSRLFLARKALASRLSCLAENSAKR
jgi:RNA polymerase sigma-70 factor (ECF subfamily)